MNNLNHLIDINTNRVTASNNVTNYANNLNFTNNTTKYGILKLYVNSQNTGLLNLYQTHIHTHNQAILNDPFPNSGFDLFVPDVNIFNCGNKNQMINHQVKCEMSFVDTASHLIEPSAYMMYPRSSISKTELMLSNHTGIIDSGYRGFLMGAFRWLKPENSEQDDYKVDRYTRLLQICLPTLHPIFVVMVDESGLTDTTRGTGGFGSTGL
jgi:dUTPase